MSKTMRKVTAACLAAALAMAPVPASAFAAAGESAGGLIAAGAIIPQALPAADYSWYTADPAAKAFTLANAAQLVGFANLVNGEAPATVSPGAVSFEGATVKLGANVNLKGNEWAPVGDADHPFQGTFDGDGKTVDNFKVTGAKRAAYLGLIGYVGKKGSVRDVKVGSSTSVSVTRDKASKDVVHHVAGVAGFCAGSMSKCTNNAKVTVKSAVVQSKGSPQVVFAVGGVAGECVGDIDECANSAAGELRVEATSVPVASVEDSGLVRYVGGVAGVNGDSTRIGSSGASIAADVTAHGSMSGCANLAQVSVDTPSAAGKDRFGETAFARGACIGGVVGYAQGDVSDCENGFVGGSYFNKTTASYGYVRAEHGTAVGGIAGSLRATPLASSTKVERVKADDGCAGDSPASTAIALSDCTNYGDVYALASAGGIVGSAGSYTTVRGCINSKRASDTFVVATRWNKPAPAGIVGTTSGDVAYCANFATVASGTWKDEANRKLENGSGYYASGIAGMLARFSKAADGGGVEYTSPVPEVHACYSAGPIMAVSDMRQRGIVGENYGYVHDNVLLAGVVEKDLTTYSESMGGTDENNAVLKADELRGKGAVGKLNALCDFEGWKTWWVPSVAGETTSAARNLGFPMLSRSNPVAEGDRVDLTGFSVEMASAAYTGGAAVPSATVKDDSGNVLVQGVDYRVVPQAGAVELGGGYAAEVRGIGRYRGSRGGLAYSIEAGDLANCRVTIEAETFNFEGHYPSGDKVKVTSAGGAVIDPGEYCISSVALARNQKKTFTPGNAPVDADTYLVTVSAAEGSRHFAKSSAMGEFVINPADMQVDVDYKNAKVSLTYNGTTFLRNWIDSTKEAAEGVHEATFPYTGSIVRPEVTGLTYCGRTLVRDRDYQLVFGNKNALSGTESVDVNNAGTESGTALGCVTVRFMADASRNYRSNFKNYANMFFNITNGLASATVTGVADKAWTGKAVTQNPVVKVGSTTLVEGRDYTVSYKDNVNAGTATIVIAGKGDTPFAGTKTVTFKIGKKNTLSAKAKTKTLTVAFSKKAKRTVAAKKAFVVKKAQGMVTYKKLGGNKGITVASDGKVTVKKGLKRGMYAVKVSVMATGDKTHLAGSKTVTLKVKVK